MKTILEGCLVYCDRLETISLHYVCVEEIKETIYHPFKILEDSSRRLQARNRELARLDRNDYVYENERYGDFDRETETNKFTYDYVQKQAEAFQARPELEFGTEHRFEKNGIRFPSKHFIRELYIRQPEYSTCQEKLLKSELEVKFKDYKFFIVETEVKYTAPPDR